MSKNVRNKYDSLGDKRNVTGSKIKQYRMKKGLSVQQLSDKLIIMGLDLHRQAIFKIEAGKRTITDYELGLIAEVLEISIDELMNEFINKIREENK